MSVCFDVPGVPRPQGSKVAMRGRVLDANATTLRPWREAVSLAAAASCPALLQGPLRVALTFTLPRPASHAAQARSAAVRDRLRLPIGRGTGDLDKLCRAVLDSMTGTVYGDDVQVVVLSASKVYWGSLVALPFVGVHVEVEAVPVPAPVQGVLL